MKACNATVRFIGAYFAPGTDRNAAPTLLTWFVTNHEAELNRLKCELFNGGCGAGLKRYQWLLIRRKENANEYQQLNS